MSRIIRSSSLSCDSRFSGSAKSNFASRLAWLEKCRGKRVRPAAPEEERKRPLVRPAEDVKFRASCISPQQSVEGWLWLDSCSSPPWMFRGMGNQTQPLTPSPIRREIPPRERINKNRKRKRTHLPEGG